MGIIRKLTDKIELYNPQTGDGFLHYDENNEEVVSDKQFSTKKSVTVTEGEAIDTLHYGSNQDRANAGDNSVALGFGARADGDNVTATGYQAAKQNPANNVTAVGYDAVGGDGLADTSQMGANVAAVGIQAARDNTGDGVIAIGYEAADTNTTNDILVVTDQDGIRRMEMDLTNGDLKIDGSLTQNASL